MFPTVVAQWVKNPTSIHEDEGSVPAIAGTIQPVAWENPYAAGAALKKKKKKKRKEISMIPFPFSSRRSSIQFFIVFLFRAASMAYETSQAGGPIGAAAARLPQPQQCRI